MAETEYRDGDTALIIALPEAEPVVGEWRARFDPSTAFGVPAHVSVLVPFLARERLDPVVLRELAELFAGQQTFELAFRRTGRFADTASEVLYLVPEPADRLRALTHAVFARWPEAPPYGGRFDDVVPHLTVAFGPWAAQLELRIRPLLPFTARPVEVLLVAFDGEAWRTVQVFPLGATPRV